MGAWSLWNDRNSVIHKRPIPNVIDRCEWINEYIIDFWMANPKGGINGQMEEDNVKIISEGEDFIMHTDAALVGN